MKTSLLSLALAAAVLTTAAPRLFAEDAAHGHLDVAPYIENNKIVAGGYSHDNPAEDTPGPITAFGYEFGEDPADPYFAFDPGFSIRKPASGTAGWNNGSQLRFNILTSLQYWDGTGPFALTAPAATDFLQWNRGSNTRDITSTSGPQTGYLITSANTSVATGADILHTHLNTFLWGASGDGVNFGDPGFIAPAAGIYAFQIELTTNQAGVENSDPIWFVYNNGASEEAHEAAVDALAGNAPAVPEPASLALLSLGAAALLTRRRS